MFDNSSINCFKKSTIFCNESTDFNYLLFSLNFCRCFFVEDSSKFSMTMRLSIWLEFVFVNDTISFIARIKSNEIDDEWNSITYEIIERMRSNYVWNNCIIENNQTKLKLKILNDIFDQMTHESMTKKKIVLFKNEFLNNRIRKYKLAYWNLQRELKTINDWCYQLLWSNHVWCKKHEFQLFKHFNLNISIN